MTSSLSKQLAAQYQKPWTSELETKLQGEIAALVAECNARKLKIFNVVVTRPNGTKVVRPIDFSRLAKTRSLQ